MIWYRSITWWIGIVMIALTLIIMTESAGWSMGGKLFPWIIGSGVLITAGLHSILGIFQGVKLAEDEDEEAESEKLDLRRVLSVFIWVLAVLVAVPLVGLQIAVPVFVFLFMKLHGETLTLAAISALIIYGFIVFVLEDIIHVVFPQALIIQWIGF